MKSETLTDPRALRSREALRKSFEELAAERPYANLTIKEVTSRASLDRTTFYLHYPGMHALLEDCTRVLFDEMRAGIYANKQVDYHQDLSLLEPFVASVFKHLEKHARFYRAMLGKQGDPTFKTRFQDQISELIFEPIAGTISSGPNGMQSDMTLRFFSAGFAGLAAWWLEKDMPISMEQAVKQITFNILPGYLQLIG
jgi:AcrR family transcriptional regulator